MNKQTQLHFRYWLAAVRGLPAAAAFYVVNQKIEAVPQKCDEWAFMQ